jgi:glutamyl-tRNA synthetase
MSKSYIRKLIEENPDKFLGYDDPRFGTIAGLRRRGILPQAIRELILSVGIKPGDAKISWSNLAATNRKLLDPIADRIMFTPDPVPLKVDADKCITASIPFHPEKPEKTREIRVCPNDTVYISKDDYEKFDEVRLMGLGNFTVDKHSRTIRLVNMDLNYARKKRLPIIQFVPDKGKVAVDILVPDGLNLTRISGYSESAITNYRIDDKLQFVRFGFIRIDKIVRENIEGAGKNYRYTVIFAHT